MPTSNPTVHYLAVSGIKHTKDLDLKNCIKRQKRIDWYGKSNPKAQYCLVYKIPLPIEAFYFVNGMEPVVEGFNLILTINYEGK